MATLLRLALPTYIPAGFCQLVTVVAQVAMPLLVRELLTLLENNPSTTIIQQGIPYAVGMFVVLFVHAFADHRQRHLATKTGIIMRSAVVCAIYSKVLRLAPRGRSGLTSGEVANFIAVDTQKLFEVALEGHLVWSLPLSVILVTVFLIIVMGPVTLVGIAVLVMFVPIVQRITARMLSVRQERVNWTDKRVEIANSLLQGVSGKLGACCAILLPVIPIYDLKQNFALVLDESYQTSKLRREVRGKGFEVEAARSGLPAKGACNLGLYSICHGRIACPVHSCYICRLRSCKPEQHPYSIRGLFDPSTVQRSSLSNQLRRPTDRKSGTSYLSCTSPHCFF